MGPRVTLTQLSNKYARPRDGEGSVERRLKCRDGSKSQSLNSPTMAPLKAFGYNFVMAGKMGSTFRTSIYLWSIEIDK